ncbi:hypothetical protein [Streptomyces sp. NPDC001165]|uniref:hypothetical protein n=1 Tax=Streptomyces sp. NPDC001165 TaxID=3364546 RepID=UPI00369CF98B
MSAHTDEAVRAKVIEIADVLAQESPQEPVHERALSWFVDLQTKGESVEFYRAVLDALPDVEPGETGGAYAERALQGVRR